MEEFENRKTPRSETNRSEEFRLIYTQNLWQGSGSRSGPGSEGVFAEEKVSVLQQIIHEHSVRSLCDIGCGDFHWMQEVVSSVPFYQGIDIVPDLIAENIKSHGRANTRFLTLDIAAFDDSWKMIEAKSWDLIVCVDVFGHLLNAEVDAALSRLVSSIPASYLLVTNRRDVQSSAYLERPKSRSEGIDIEVHPAFANSHWKKAGTRRARYPGDWFDLYRSVRNTDWSGEGKS